MIVPSPAVPYYRELFTITAGRCAQRRHRYAKPRRSECCSICLCCVFRQWSCAVYWSCYYRCVLSTQCRALTLKVPYNNYRMLEVATPTPRPFQAAAAMLLPGEVMAIAWLPTCDVISARQWSYP